MNWRRLLLRIGSMNAAVMLLAALAVASVAGTVLQQNRPGAEYLLQFGPFWHQIYQTLGLYDVYASAWFVTVLGLLMLSTALCVIRNAPGVLRQLADYRKPRPEAALRQRANFRAITLPLAPEPLGARLCQVLRARAWRVRRNGEYIGAARGRINRLAYLLVHLSILLICAGGLLDSSAALRLRIASGQLAVEKRDLPAREVPAQSRLGSNHRAFRSSVLIPEGKASNFSFINMGGGYLVQELPFTVQLLDFRVEHYPSGQPKSFASEVRLFDAAGKASTHTIAVNQPLRYQGYTLYQSSFEDGGSLLELTLRALSDPGRGNDALPAEEALAPLGEVRHVSGAVGQALSLDAGGRRYRLELEDFRQFNIFPGPDGGFVDQGPRFQYRLRAEDGTVREFLNYMQPIEIQGRHYLPSGVRSEADQDFHFLHLPLDEDFSLARFFRFHAALHDPALLAGLARELVPDPALQQWRGEELEQAIVRFVDDFRTGGLRTIDDFVRDNVEADEQEAALQIYTRLLQNILGALYQRLFPPPATPEETAREQQFFRDSVLALSALAEYGAPVFVGLEDFEQRQASGLQINRAPAAPWVYLGFLLLVSGVFAMFHVAHQRLFVLLQAQGDGSARVLIAGEPDRRHQQAFAREFAALCHIISRWNQAPGAGEQEKPQP